jgi:hypothetical protein
MPKTSVLLYLSNDKHSKISATVILDARIFVQKPTKHKLLATDQHVGAQGAA